MSKRGAGNYMTDQNWDQEEEPEDAGMFKQANKSTLNKRVIKKAARRAVGDDSANMDAGSSSTFKTFAGFSGFSKTTDAASAFSNLGSKTFTASNTPATFTNTSRASLFSVTKTEDNATVINSPSNESQSQRKTQPLTNGNGSSKSSSPKAKYLNELKTLNEGVAKWIKEHVDKNPFCILTPIFKDYENYLSDLEKKYPQHSQEKDVISEEVETETHTEDSKDEPSATKSTSNTSLDKSTAETSSGFSMTANTTSSTTSIAAPAASSSTFSFGSTSMPSNPNPLGVKPTTTAASATTLTLTGSTSTGIFGSAGSSGVSTSVFGGGSSGSSGFTFGSIPKKTEDGGSTSTADNADEEYVPPKEDVAEVKETDSLYTKRCKLFFKRDDVWKEKGVGNLHLKPCGDKTQLLIRADTNLGNILLNIMLSSSLPLSRQGKNNVTIVCVPNPTIDGMEENSMVPMLIRVKTSEDADELLEKLKEHKS